MDQPVKNIYDVLEKEVIGLHFDWQLYRQLYGTTSESIDVLNGVASDVFAVFQDVLWDHIVLTIGKLNDTLRTGSHENASLENLIDEIDDVQHVAFKQSVLSDLRNLRARAQAIENDRNKRIAHFDKARLFGSGRGVVSRQDVEEVLELVRNIMNKIKFHFDSSKVIYEMKMHHHGDALIRYFQFCGSAQEVNKKRVDEIKRNKSNDLS